jgi:hypothetical protein
VRLHNASIQRVVASVLLFVVLVSHMHYTVCWNTVSATRRYIIGVKQYEDCWETWNIAAVFPHVHILPIPFLCTNWRASACMHTRTDISYRDADQVLSPTRKVTAHQALATQKELAYLHFQCLYHPPYSPDLAPSDYHLYPGLKNDWKGSRSG